MAGPAGEAKGPRILVFGGSGALGGEVCRQLADQGARVAFTYFQGEERAMALAKSLPGCLSMKVDLKSVVEVEGVVDEVDGLFHGIDGFVQCAGVAVTMECDDTKSPHLMGNVDVGGWDRMMNINTRSTYFAARRLAEVMRRGGGGNIVVIGSVDSVKPAPAPVHYAASKGALLAMVRSMAKELGPDGIRVNMVAPGILEGGMTQTLPENLMEEYLKHCGLRRVARLSEVAAIVAELALRNTYVTGEVLLADGAL